jgi:hypothetical protein
MRINIIIIFCFCFLCFYRCTTHTQQEYSLKISIIESNTSYAFLYGFFGDNQLFVDSLPVIDKTITYSISTSFNPGVYRLVFDNNQSFDFIFNNENIEIQLNPEAIQETFKIIASEENKLLYSFLLALQSVYVKSNDSLHNPTEVAALYNQVFSPKSHYNIDTNTLAFSVISLFEAIEFNMYSMFYPELSDIDAFEQYLNIYMANIQLQDSRILNTPYYYLILQRYLETIINIDSTRVFDACEHILKQSKHNKEIQIFTESFLYEYIYHLNSVPLMQNYISKIYGNNACVLQDISHTPGEFASYGTNMVELQSFISFEHTGFSLLLFTNTECPTYEQVKKIIGLERKQLLENNISMHFLTEKYGSFIDICDAFSVHSVPTLIVVDNLGIIRSRTYEPNTIHSIIKFLKN